MQPTHENSRFVLARHNARLAKAAFERCRRYVAGWLTHTDTVTDLIPRDFRESR